MVFYALSAGTVTSDRLVGLVVKASASRAADLGSILAFVLDLFLGRVIPVKMGTPAATLPDPLCYRVSAGTGCPVSVYCDWMR